MNKKRMIIINIILLITMIFSNTNVYATTMGEIIDDGDGFLRQGNSVASTIDKTKLNDTSNTIYNILLTIAIVLAVIIGMIIGIQFMMGSVEEQAKVKETLVPYIVGVFVVFAAFGIWKIVVNIGNEISPTPYDTTSTEQNVPGDDAFDDLHTRD